MTTSDLRGVTEAIARHTLALFMGADLPAEQTGLPSRADLAIDMAQRYGLGNPASLAEAAAQVGAGGSRYEFTQGLRQALDLPGRKPQPFHHQLAALIAQHSIETIITIAYDDLLERAFASQAIAINRLVRGGDVPFARPGQPTLIKLYGDLQQVDTLVVTDRDHTALLRDGERRPLLDEVRRTLRRNTVLFLGCHFADADLRFLFDEVAESQFAPLAYAAWPGLSARESLVWRDRGVQIIDASALEVLAMLGASAAPAASSQASVGDAPAAPVAKADAASSRSPAPPQPPALLNRGQAWALLAGVNEYDDAQIRDLRVCVADVRALAQQLAQTYASVTVLADDAERPPTRANLLGELATLAQLAGEDDLLLFYFSGHGIAVKGESYLAPRDARLAALTYTSASMAEVRAILLSSAARAKIIILDACHSGATIGKDVPSMTPEFLEHVFEHAEGMAVLASCKQGQVSWEWPDRGHSVFTMYLLEALAGRADFDRKGFVTVTDANRYVADGVKRWSAQHGAPQTPTLNYTVAGDIILCSYSPQPRLNPGDWDEPKRHTGLAPSA